MTTRRTPLKIIILIALSVSLTPNQPILCEEAPDQDGAESRLLPSEGESVLVFDMDGFKIDQSFAEALTDGLRSKEEHELETSTRHPFEKACPSGFFRCANSECIAQKWRCDNHYDCDDLSDELNCTSIDMPSTSGIIKSTYVSPKQLASNTSKQLASKEIYGITFNSSVEPLMIFSTGSSIRGLWMKSRLYFDIVSVNNHQAAEVDQKPPSITQAFSIFFDLFNADNRQSSSTSSKSSEDKETVKSKSVIVGVDMDPAKKEVYWVELGKDPGVFSAMVDDDQLEPRQRRQFHGHRKIIEYGLMNPEDIALDNVGKNAYITDAGLPAIVVCSLGNSVHCRIIVNEQIHKPRAIIVDSTVGWITFTDWGDDPGIFLASMDGKLRETLIDTDVVWPNGLASDYQANFLYWADARLNKIERVDLKTRKRVVLVKDKTNPFSVSMFENRIYWSDWSGNDLKSCDKTTGNNTRVVMHVDDIYGIHIYHPDIHAKEPSDPCWSKHCSHLCLLSPKGQTYSDRVQGSVGATCACPDSMVLSIGDRSSCYEVQWSFLLVNIHNYIAQVFPDRIGLRVVEEIIYSKEHAIQDVIPDWIHYKLYFFDASRQIIYSADMSGPIPSLQKFITVGKVVRGLTYDTLSENLYWLDSDVKTMFMCSTRTKFKKALRTDLDNPVAMVLDVKNRVFYIATIGAKPRIIRTDIQGNVHSDAILIDTDIGLPVALHLDRHQQRLYWADAKRETIESVELDVKSRTTGSVVNTRVRHRRRIGTVLGFAVFHDSFVWTVQNSDYLFKSKIDADRDARPVTFKLMPNPMAKHPSTDNKRILLVDPVYEAVASLCASKSCSHGCYVDASHESFCICPDNYKFQRSNSSNCIESSMDDEPFPFHVNHPVDGQLPPGLRDMVSHAATPDSISTSGGTLMVPHKLDDDNHAQVSHIKSSEANVAHQDIHHAPWDEKISTSTLDNHHTSPFDRLADGKMPPFMDHNFQEALHGPSEDSGLSGMAAHNSKHQPEDGNKMVWLIVLLLLLSVTALITVITVLILYKQGKLPRQVSQLSVSFISPNSHGGGHSSSQPGADKDRAMLLLDTDA